MVSTEVKELNKELRKCYERIIDCLTVYEAEEPLDNEKYIHLCKMARNLAFFASHIQQKKLKIRKEYLRSKNLDNYHKKKRGFK